MNLDDIESLFFQYITECEEIIKKSGDSLQAICKRHSLQYDKDMLQYQIEYLLKEQLEGILGDVKGDFKIEKLRRLKSHLLLKQYGLGLEFGDFIKYIDCILAYCSNNVLLLNIKNDNWWSNLLLIVLDYLNISNNNSRIEYPGMNIKEKNEGEAIKYWLNKGYRINVENGKVKIAEKEYARMGLEIDKCVREVGGKLLIQVLLKSTKFDKKNLRYNLHRKKSNLEINISSEIPFGYLFNLSVKHYRGKLNKKVEIKKITDLIEMTRYYTALLQLQTYSNMSDLFITQDHMIEHIYNNVLYDSIFLYKQYNPIYISRMIKGMLRLHYEAIDYQKVFKGLKFDDVCTLINYILNHPSQQQSFRYFTIDGLCSIFPKFPRKAIEQFLYLFSHQDIPNKEFYYPNSVSTFEDLPLLKINNEYILIDRTLNSFSFFDSLCNILRKEYGENFDNMLGISLEEFIKKLLEKSNIEFSSGYYKINEECDIVIETDKITFFLEVKKKPLTKKSLTGDGVKLFVDISKSIIDSQLQLGKHEINLIKDNKIDLYSKKGKVKKGTMPLKTIVYKKNIIERISVNLNEFGILSDKMMVQKILNLITGNELKALDDSRDLELEEIRKKAKKLLEQFNERNFVDGSVDLRKMYFNTSFMSLQMLMIRLQNVSNNDEFEKEYLSGKFITTGTGDNYLEYFRFLDRG